MYCAYDDDYFDDDLCMTYFYFLFFHGCDGYSNGYYANFDCAPSANDPSIPMNIDIIVAGMIYYIYYAALDWTIQQNLDVSVVVVMLMHRNFHLRMDYKYNISYI